MFTESEEISDFTEPSMSLDSLSRLIIVLSSLALSVLFSLSSSVELSSFAEFLSASLAIPSFLICEDSIPKDSSSPFSSPPIEQADNPTTRAKDSGINKSFL